MAAGAGAALGVAAEDDAGGVGGCVPVGLEVEVSFNRRRRMWMRMRGEGKRKGK